MGVAFGATHTINSTQVDPVEAIRELTDGKGVHYAFEAIGLVPEPYKQAILCTASARRHRLRRTRSRQHDARFGLQDSGS